MDIKLMKSDEELMQCFAVIQELRSHLTSSKEFINRVRIQEQESYQIAATVSSQTVLSYIGFRIMHTLAWGKIVYVDDLVTSSSSRANGAALKLMDYVIDFAKQNNCDQVHLDSGYQRNLAHRFYLNRGFNLTSHHFSLMLK